MERHRNDQVDGTSFSINTLGSIWQSGYGYSNFPGVMIFILEIV